MDRRLFLLLLVALLPLQFAWAAVTSYCEHETGAAAQHFGHHEHVHHAAKAKAAHSPLAADDDCGVCHSAGAPAVLAAGASLATFLPARVAFAEPVARWPSRVPPIPERPQWRRPA